MSHTLDELMRDSLDHCVKCTICETLLPGGRRDAPVPRAEVRRPAGRALPVPGGPSPDALARLLLELRHLHPGVPAGREDRRDQLARRGRGSRRDHGIPLRDRLIARPTLAGRLGDAGRRRSPTGRCGNRLAAEVAGEDARGSTARRPCPTWAGRTFQPLGAPHGHAPARPAAASRTVVYFHGCGGRTTTSRRRRAAVAVLEHNGFQVIVPRQGCCGLPLQSNGLFDDARGYVRRLARSSRRTPAPATTSWPPPPAAG